LNDNLKTIITNLAPINPLLNLGNAKSKAKMQIEPSVGSYSEALTRSLGTSSQSSKSTPSVSMNPYSFATIIKTEPKR
jgi:hypothetical protein